MLWVSTNLAITFLECDHTCDLLASEFPLHPEGCDVLFGRGKWRRRQQEAALGGGPRERKNHHSSVVRPTQTSRLISKETHSHQTGIGTSPLYGTLMKVLKYIDVSCDWTTEKSHSMAFSSSYITFLFPSGLIVPLLQQSVQQAFKLCSHGHLRRWLKVRYHVPTCPTQWADSSDILKTDIPYQLYLNIYCRWGCRPKHFYFKTDTLNIKCKMWKLHLTLQRVTLIIILPTNFC